MVVMPRSTRNAQGGRIYIGMKDNGDVCGVDDAKRLLEDIPNKIRVQQGPRKLGGLAVCMGLLADLLAVTVHLLGVAVDEVAGQDLHPLGSFLLVVVDAGVVD